MWAWAWSQRNVPKYPLKQLNTLCGEARRSALINGNRRHSPIIIIIIVGGGITNTSIPLFPYPSSSCCSSLSFVRYCRLELFKMQMPLWHATGRLAYMGRGQEEGGMQPALGTMCLTRHWRRRRRASRFFFATFCTPAWHQLISC